MFVRSGRCCLTARRLTSQATIYTITSMRSDIGENGVDNRGPPRGLGDLELTRGNNRE